MPLRLLRLPFPPLTLMQVFLLRGVIPATEATEATEATPQLQGGI
jgi:hypothetical protein